MSKFKVGDRVVNNYNKTGIVMEVRDKCVRIQWDDSLNPADWKTNAFWPEAFHHLVNPNPTSPIVEKTVKSVVPGVYGRVAVETTFLEKENRLTIYLADSAGEYKQYDYGMIMTASELEAAAKTFMELAEYLRERE